MYLVLSSLLTTLAAASPLGKRDDRLSCVQFQYGGPFTSFGLNGWIHLYANVTQFHPDTQTTTFNVTQVGVDGNGEIAACGDCRSTQQFGFEVCQGPDGKGYEGLSNSPEFFYGHILFTYDQSDIQCLEALRIPVNGSTVRLADCQYRYSTAGKSNQYFLMSTSTGPYEARLVQDDSAGSYGPIVDSDGVVELYDGPATGPFSFFGFQAPIF
ncbi:hypothetical protein TREMEDRAFT_29816 [Tremella mesenterica DSM 1558]|uniref:uncharacterized protein n=1 Tax=Tremella mesenterica (strain ATCC 24925 / CBS 8224 / DSM 1558 / NBRC 9311 / NRRL Y-6157 / RJB 2259-6 / UBC 559-6) TaxID=578456 RepID=UPI0003F4A3F6|nr:uncharacterized protein TREMEDRAFT_29816 [Tremella mesenterica DSM 1558]EIW69733.1 hypothetical protein TREMEDRAFT_29816 [Tremella mesenterica DSM 1558]